jgi:hypothetical protein
VVVADARRGDIDAREHEIRGGGRVEGDVDRGLVAVLIIIDAGDGDCCGAPSWPA